ncbi:hypothetical protein PG996_004731 [Apiospora saccharicola]|uniref:Uncharacterized protein n=1 Tax=Apiospora saccharicola TaxID=335842 RepID=A0ABR1W7M9_9PEZI
MAECLDIRKELEAIQCEGKITSQEFAENLVRCTSPNFREQFIQACVDQGVLSAEYVEASRKKYNNPQDNKNNKKEEEEKAAGKHKTEDNESKDDAMQE